MLKEQEIADIKKSVDDVMKGKRPQILNAEVLLDSLMRDREEMVSLLCEINKSWELVPEGKEKELVKDYFRGTPKKLNRLLREIDC